MELIFEFWTLNFRKEKATFFAVISSTGFAQIN
jgi:hypothetical protein